MILVNIMNSLTTTFLAVARCMFVAKHLHFKHYFIVKRTVVSMSGFVVFAVASYKPVLASMGMVTRLDTKTNVSRPSLWFSPFRESIKNVIWTLIQMVLPVTTEFIVVVCILIMINSLHAVPKFRQTLHLHACDRKISQLKGNNDNSNDANDKFSGKDIRVVKQVTLISLVYIHE